MSSYLFVTKEERDPGDIKSNQGGWSCSKAIRTGDLILVYITGVGISFEWTATSDAEPDDDWQYACDVAYVRAIKPPITIKEIKSLVRPEEWKPPHLNFRGFRSLSVPDEIYQRLSSLRMGKKSIIPPAERTQQTLARANSSPVARGDQLTELEAKFQQQIASSLRLSKVQRRTRLRQAKTIPTARQVLTTAFDRNPHVVAEVLSRAAGHCEVCRARAPFLRASDGSPYLEVHHKKRLSQGGEDTVQNAAALCPNCHRKAHFGL